MKKVSKFGKFVRGHRLHKDLTSIDMSIALEVSPAMVSATERGSKKVPNSWIPKIANFLDLSLDEVRKLHAVIKTNNEIIDSTSEANCVTEETGKLQQPFYEAAFSK